MNIFYLAALGFFIGTVLFVVESKSKRGTFLGNVLLGVTGSIVGGIYANLIFGVNFSKIGIGGILVALFSSLLLLFVGRIIRNSGSDSHSSSHNTSIQ